jgi:hypothetical protein
MSYEFAASLQRAVYGRLMSDQEVTGLVGASIHDAPITSGVNEVPAEYVTLGEERTRPNDTKTSRGAVHDFTVVVHSGRDGFETAKRIAGAVCASLLDAPLSLDRGRLVALRFLQARADRGPAPEKRRVALKFRAVVDQNDE